MKAATILLTTIGLWACATAPTSHAGYDVVPEPSQFGAVVFCQAVLEREALLRPASSVEDDEFEPSVRMDQVQSFCRWSEQTPANDLEAFRSNATDDQVRQQAAICHQRLVDDWQCQSLP